MTPLSRRTALKRMGAAAALPLFATLPTLDSGWAQTTANIPFARRVADFVCGVRFEDLDPAAIERAKEHLIYHVGLAFSGAQTDSGRQAIEIARTLGKGRGQTTIIGQPFKAPALDAAFANSMFMRALGFDDVLFPSATHAGLLTYPVALALGEQYHRSGKELLVSVVTGYEVLGKMARPIKLDRLRRPSMPLGPFASVTVAARLLQLTPTQTANAIGYAADTAMGLKEGNEQQPTHVYGWIARNAIMAAIVAQAGGETAATILEGEYGFYRTLVGEVPDVDAVVSRLGKDPEILRATQKRYPGTAMNIVPIQFVLELVEQYRLSAANVQHVEIELPDDRPTFKDSYSQGPFPSRTQAESSVAFQTAIILLDGGIDFERYDQLNNPEILSVIEKISFVLVPHDNDRYARVRITTVDGVSYERQGQDYVFPPIDSVAWLSRDGEKFVPRANLERFAAAVRDLEEVPDVGELLTWLAPTQ